MVMEALLEWYLPLFAVYGATKAAWQVRDVNVELNVVGLQIGSNVSSCSWGTSFMTEKMTSTLLLS